MSRFFNFLLLVFSCFSMYAQSSWVFLKNKEKVSIPFDLINNMVIVHPEVNGTKLNLVLDTGSNSNLIFGFQEQDSIAFSYITKIKITGPGVAEPLDAYVSKNNEIKFKNLYFKEATIVLLLHDSYELTSNINIPIHGILGTDFFKNNIVEINYVTKRVIMYQSEPRKLNKTDFKQIDFRLKDGKLYLPIQLNIENKFQQQLELLLDTGLSDGLWLLNKPIELEQITTIYDFLGVGLGGEIFGKRARYSTIKINDFLIDKPIVSFPDSLAFSFKNFFADRDGSIGGELLKRFTLLFDYPHEKIYLKPNRNFYEPFLYNMAGIKIQHGGLDVIEEKIRIDKPSNAINVNEIIFEDSKFRFNYVFKPGFEVAFVRINSPAYRAGIVKGDKIISVNKRKAINYTLDQLMSIFETNDGQMIELKVEREGQLLTYFLYLETEI